MPKKTNAYIHDPTCKKNSNPTHTIDIETIDTNINLVDLLISVMAPIRGAVNNRVRFEITNVQLKYSADDAESSSLAQY
jgi:hypothetical protein